MQNDKMKILIINYEYPPLGGGGGVATRDLAIEWSKHCQVDVITSSFKGLKKFEKVDDVNIYRVRILFRKSRDAANFISLLTYLPGAIIKGILLIKKNRYSIINTHFVLPSGPVGFVLGKLFDIPNVISLHGGDLYEPSKRLSPHRSKIFTMIIKFLLNRADDLVAQSGNTRDNAIKYYNPGKNIKIIPLPFHAPVIKKMSRNKLKLNKEDFILITCGRLIKRKAIDVIIKALSEIESNKFKLLVMGDGPERETLEKLAVDYGLGERVVFLGFVNESEKFQYLSAADAFILTSMHEGFGIVYMEAMCCGLPIICANEGGQVDFLIQRQNALLIDVGDVKACSDAVKELSSNAKLYNKLSNNNKIKIKEFYAKKIAESYIKTFNDLVSGENIGN